MRSPFRIAATALLVVLSSSLSAGSLRAEEDGPKRLSDTHMLSGSVVRWAFRDVIRRPRRWTADVFHGGEKVSLGTIVGSDGWILTKGSELKVPLVCRLPDGRRLPAEYVAYHEPTDLALLKVDAENLTVVEWDQSGDPEVGQWLITPGTGRRPVAVGVVSVARRVIPREHYRGVLGVEFDSRVEDPLIKRVFPDSAAAAAGLRPGDLIVRVGERDVFDRQEVIEEIGTRRPGEVVTIQVRRETDQLTVSARLTHPFGEFLSRIAEQNQMGGNLSFRRDDFPAGIQADTVLEPSECGGSVVTLSGQAIGVNIARAGRTQTYILPADQISPLLEQLKSGEFLPPAASFSELLSLDPLPPAPHRPEPIE